MNSKLKKWLSGIFLLIWAIVLTVYLSIKTGGHLLAYKIPDDPLLVVEKLREKNKVTKVKLQAFHFIYLRCTCANSLIRHFIKRGKHRDWQETIIIDGPDKHLNKKLRSRGFQVMSLDSEEIETDFGVIAVPLLLALKDNVLVYAGGYYDRPANYRSLDLEIYSSILNQEKMNSLPLYGCAFDKQFVP